MRARRLLASTGALAVALLSSAGLTGASAPTAASGGTAGCESPATSAARVVKGAKVKEPALFDKNDANKYGVIKPHARLANGSVDIRTVFHVISDHALTAAENTPHEHDDRRPGAGAERLLQRGRPAPRRGHAVPLRRSPGRRTRSTTTWSTVVPGKAGSSAT